ncbi:MAG: antitoxin [Gemmatimonadales bacterium]|jgi:antitoxin component of MazEF toxin-antitoxin module
MSKPKKSAAGAAMPGKAVMETRVFRSGNSYAVRLPKPIYSGGEGAVYVTKLAGGELLIAPKSKRRWPAGFWSSFGTLPNDFEAPPRTASNKSADAVDASLFRSDE